MLLQEMCFGADATGFVLLQMVLCCYATLLL